MALRVKWRPVRLGGLAHAFRVVSEGIWVHYRATALCGEPGRSRYEDDNQGPRCAQCVRMVGVIRGREKKA